jgi:NTF2 fold immunity protein
MNDNTEQMIADAKSVVLRFAAAYTEWELAMAKDEENSMDDPAMRQAHAGIIASYCTPKKRAYVDDCLSYSEPPTYSHVIEDNIMNAELISDTRAHIDISGDTSPLQTSHRFVVLRKKDGWQIDGVKWRVSDGDEWNNGLIGS